MVLSDLSTLLPQQLQVSSFRSLAPQRQVLTSFVLLVRRFARRTRLRQCQDSCPLTLGREQLPSFRPSPSAQRPTTRSSTDRPTRSMLSVSYQSPFAYRDSLCCTEVRYGTIRWCSTVLQGQVALPPSSYTACCTAKMRAACMQYCPSASVLCAVLRSAGSAASMLSTDIGSAAPSRRQRRRLAALAKRQDGRGCDAVELLHARLRTVTHSERLPAAVFDDFGARLQGRAPLRLRCRVGLLCGPRIGCRAHTRCAVLGSGNVLQYCDRVPCRVWYSCGVYGTNLEHGTTRCA